MSSFLQKLEAEAKDQKMAEANSDEEGSSNEEMEESKDEIAELPNKQGSDFCMDHHVTTANLVANTMPQVGQEGYVPHVIHPHMPPTNLQGVNALKSQYDPLPWSDFFDSTEKIEDQVPLYKAGSSGHIYVCLHGAGHSAMSFAAFASQMKTDSIVYAFDHRGHGTHTCENETELSQENLISDTLRVMEFVRVRHPNQSLTLCGHSMGGSIAVKTARRLETTLKDTPLAKALSAIVIIDVVEGTAMEALPFMESVVQNRPVSFTSEQAVVKYGVSSGQVRDKRSARVSMPSQVVRVTAGDGVTRYVWRTDLMATKPYWIEWFTGLSKDFLESSTKKLLFLAGSERMDKELSIAQMQGKFALRVISECGHVIQEDQPRRLAEACRDWRDAVKVPVEVQDQMFIVNASGKKIFINR